MTVSFKFWGEDKWLMKIVTEKIENIIHFDGNYINFIHYIIEKYKLENVFKNCRKNTREYNQFV